MVGLVPSWVDSALAVGTVGLGDSVVVLAGSGRGQAPWLKTR